ncbi:MAG: PEGA domain-containing protein, partial [Gemmatimonadetes bacterium]
MRWMGWGLLLLGSAWPVSADAQIWVITRGEPIDDLAEARERVAAALAEEGNVADPQRMTALFEERISSPPTFVTQRQINEWATQSRNALHSLARADYDTAREELLRAQRLSQRAAEELNREADRAREVLDTCLYMVRALIETGDEARAISQARECRRAVPQVQPSRFRHTPEVRAILERIEAEETGEVGNLRVDSIPPGCRVRLNGIEVGRTPFSMADLALGEYRVQVECGEERGRVHRVRLDGLLTTLEVDTVFERETHSRPVFVDDNDRAEAHAARLARLLGVSVYMVEAAGAGRFR